MSHEPPDPFLDDRAEVQRIATRRDEANAQLSELHRSLLEARAFGDRECAARMEAQAESARVRAARDSLADDLAAVRADAEVTRVALERARNLYAGVYETLKEFDVYDTGGDAASCAREVKMQLSERTTAVEERIRERDAALTQVAALREALSMHVEVYGEPFHDDPAGSCDFDRQGGQRDCPRCVVNAMSAAALADTEKAAREHDERVGGEAAGRERAIVYCELWEGALDGQLAEHDAKVWDRGVGAAWHRATQDVKQGFGTLVGHPFSVALDELKAKTRAAALEEAAEAGAFRVTDYDNVGVELEIIADRVRRAIQDIAATPSAAPAPERAKCKACGGTGNTGWPLRVTCAVCNGNGGTGEVK